MTAIAKTFLSKVTLDDNARSRIKSYLKGETEVFPADIFSPVVELIFSKCRAVILSLNDSEKNSFDPWEIHQLNPIIGEVFGKLLVQNDQGQKVIAVYDRDRTGSMFKGARYHQTREGGSIHTDNVNVPEPWEVLYLSCLAPALVGGENILVDGVKVHQELKRSYPLALKILESPFIWEMRGVADKLYEAPIISYDENGEPLFRHLRPYMESAHEKAQKPLTKEQLYAVDVLDALTNSFEFQEHYRMKTGDVLLTIDSQVLHGRTCFSDHIEAVSVDDFQHGKGQILKRTMERLWIKI